MFVGAGAEPTGTIAFLVTSEKRELTHDECLTPDSSRFWPQEGYEEGKVQPSYDKQYVRDWLRANWDMTGEPPHLPTEVIEGTSARYQEAFQIITGSKFEAMR